MAHALNAFTRIFLIVQKLNMEILTDFGKLQTVHDRNVTQLLCENSDVVRVAAIQTVRDGDVKSACSKFLDVIAQVFQGD